MPLNKALVEVLLSSGIDTKTNAKLTLPGSLLRAENAVFREGVTLKKRNGYAPLATDTQAGGTIDGGSALSRYKNELLLYDAGALYSYSTAIAKWIARGEAPAFTARAERVTGNQTGVSNPDVASNGNVTLYAWADSRGGIRASVVDEETGTAFLSDTEVSATGTRPRCVLIGQHLFVVYYAGTDIRAKRIDTLDPSAFSGEFVLRVDGHGTAGSKHLDVAPVEDLGNSEVAVAAYVTTTGTVCVFYLLEDGQVGDLANGYPTPRILTDADATQAVAVISGTDLSGIVGVAYAGAGGLYGDALPRESLDWLAGSRSQWDADANIVNVTIEFAREEETRIFSVYEVSDATPTEHRLKWANCDTNFQLENSGELIRSLGLASKSWRVEHQRCAVIGVFAGELQSHYFVLSRDLVGEVRVEGKLLSQNAGGLQSGQVPSVVTNVDERFWSAPYKARIVFEGQVTYSQVGLAKSTLDYGDTNLFRGAQAGDAFILPGGLVSMYDGASVVELGFHVFPEFEDAYAPTHDNADGAMESEGRYAFVFLYEWYDARGQVHRSAPSVPILFDVPAGTNQDSLEFEVPTLRVTSKQGDRPNARIICFSTKKDGTVFYRTPHEGGSAVEGVENDPSSDTVTFKRTVIDTDIERNEILYSQGTNGSNSGVLENVCPPAARLLAVGKDRVLLAGLENPCGWWYSKILRSGIGVEFTDFLQGEINPDGGEITAVAILDDKIVFFKRDTIYVMGGDGPDNLGQNDTFGKAYPLACDVGCIDPRSVVQTPTGVAFQSAKGIHELTRGLSVDYIGAAVEAFNAQTITQATLDEDVNQIRFLTDDGYTLVYDYFFRQWATWTNHEGQAACFFDGTYHYLRNDGEVYREIVPTVEELESGDLPEGAFTDDGLPIHMLLRTGWIKPGSIQGLKRIWRIGLLGDFYSDHQLHGEVFYDYRAFSQDSFTWDPAAVFDGDEFGDDVEFGDDDEFGGGESDENDSVYQVRKHLKRQRCEAISILISDVGSDPGRAYSLSAIVLEVGGMPGMLRLPAGKTV